MFFRSYLKSLYITLLILTFFSGQSRSQDTISCGNSVSLLFMGDIMGHDSQILSARDTATDTYNYENVFRYIKPVISGADIAIANLEVTLAGSPYMGYPQFSSPAALAAACQSAGIDYLVTANNHAADRGRKGIISTINKLDSLGIPHTGTYLSSQSRDTLSPLMIRSNGITMALLNYTYATNGIRVPKPVIVDSLDRDLIIRDIKKARNKNADAVILFLHWGTEYDTVPRKDQEKLAALLLSEGADLIIGSHPHVVQKMVWMKEPENGKDRVVVYSLGNFVSNQRKPKTDGGSLVRIEICKNDNGIKVLNAGYYLTWVYTPFENFRRKFYILPCSQFENKPDFFPNESDFVQMKKFIDDTRLLFNTQNMNIGEIIYKPEEP